VYCLGKRTSSRGLDDLRQAFRPSIECLGKQIRTRIDEPRRRPALFHANWRKALSTTRNRKKAPPLKKVVFLRLKGLRELRQAKVFTICGGGVEKESHRKKGVVRETRKRPFLRGRKILELAGRARPKGPLLKAGGERLELLEEDCDRKRDPPTSGTVGHKEPSFSRETMSFASRTAIKPMKTSHAS